MKMKPLIEKVTVPEGQRGLWSVERFEVTKEDAAFQAIRSLFNGGRGVLQPGRYTRLRHAKLGVVMSDTPDEMRDHREPVVRASGHVLINGLGLGMVLGAVLRRPEVDRVTVVEIDPDVISLVGPHYQSNRRVEIVQADAFAWQPPKGVRYGVAWHDVWHTICADHLPAMTKLKRKYGRRADWQGCWAESQCRRWR